MNTDKRIINIHSILQHLTALSSTERPRWWADAITIDWQNLRSSHNNNTTRWATITYKDVSQVVSNLSLKITNEKHVGQVVNTDDKSGQQSHNGFHKPTRQIWKYKCQVQTMEDKVSPMLNSCGKQVLPNDSMNSAYFQVVEL